MKKILSVCIAALLVIFAVIPAAADVIYLYPSETLPAETLRVTAHRGLSSLAPENTLPAYRLAGEYGFWGAECDISQTADGVWVLMHDKTVDRMTDGEGLVSDFTYAELSALTVDAGSRVEDYPGTKVPTLTEYLDVCREYGVHPVIEIKEVVDVNSLPDLAAILNAREEKDSFVLISFGRELIAGIKALLPEIPAYLLGSPCTADDVDFCLANGIDGLDTSYNVSAEVVGYAQESGLRLMAWTADSVAQAERLANLGITDLTTNCLVPQEAPAGFGAYDHVFIIGVDGAGAAFSQVDSPCFDAIFGDFACRHDAKTEYVTVSAQNWGSILTGLSYDTHGFTNSSIGAAERGSDSGNHTVFYYLRQAAPEAKMASFVNWNPINYGLIENDLGVEKYHSNTDPLVTASIEDYFSAGNAPALTFVQLDNVDHAAHAYGGFSEEYYAAVREADAQIGRIYNAVAAQGLMENGLFIVVADHGETANGHGGQTPEESAAVLAVIGKNVCHTSFDASARNRDVAAIALHALGVSRPASFAAVVPEGLFGEARPAELIPARVEGTQEPTTEPATEPATEPTTEPATEHVTEPATEPTTQPAGETDEDHGSSGPGLWQRIVDWFRRIIAVIKGWFGG